MTWRVAKYTSETRPLLAGAALQRPLVPRSGFRQQGRGERRKNGGGRVILTRLVILLLVLAPLLQGLGIEVRHHGTFLARLAFTLIGLAAFGFHPCPSLPTAASHHRITWNLWQNRVIN
jgi:hypothetical protein